MYKIQNEQFEGPLDLLLSLIEKEELDITKISLAKITGAYLEKIHELSGDSNDLADFLVIAAKLLYIKSRDLIPSARNDEEESEIEDLEIRLREYQKIKAAAKHLEFVLAYESRSFSRKAKNNEVVSFIPPKNINNGELFAIFQEILSRVPEEISDQKEIEQEKKVSLAEKRDHIFTQLKRGKPISFRHVMKNAKSKIEVIVTFLAILEMVKQKEISIEQKNNFADFMIMSVK